MALTSLNSPATVAGCCKALRTPGACCRATTVLWTVELTAVAVPSTRASAGRERKAKAAVKTLRAILAAVSLSMGLKSETMAPTRSDAMPLAKSEAK